MYLHHIVPVVERYDLQRYRDAMHVEFYIVEEVGCFNYQPCKSCLKCM